MIKLVVFDLAGTTVNDEVDGKPLVVVAMSAAFHNAGYTIDPESVNKFRGLEKKQAIAGLLHEVKSDGKAVDQAEVDRLFDEFKVALDAALFRINSEIPGTTEVFGQLRSSGIETAVGSGFPDAVVRRIVATMGWDVDFVSSAEKEGAGRPDPALIHSAMRNCGVSDPRQVLKVGDTCVDVEEGKNAGVWTAAVLTGTQDRSTLETAAPDFIVDDITHIPHVVAAIGSMQW